MSPLLLLHPTPTPLPPPSRSVGINSELFYLLLFIGTVLFVAAFFYGRKKGL